MFIVNDDKSIYVTRGDIVVMSVEGKNRDDGTPITFKPGDLVRIKVSKKKKCSDVVLEKDFPITDYTQEVQIYLSGEETKFGDVISKPVDYWYEVELNPLSDPQTIIGYDEDGAKIFKLFPEGADKEVEEYESDEEELLSRFMDDELDLTSTHPVENQVIARAVSRLEGKLKLYETAAKYNVTPQLFGAVGDGKADDTQAIKSAISSLDGVATLHFPAGTYLVSEDISLVSNMTLEGEGNNTIIKRVGNGLDKYDVISCKGIENVTIKNIHIQGDRNEHTTTEGEWGMCIGLYGTKNINIKDCKLTDAWGDGVYVGTGTGPCNNTVVDNCFIDNNRRQGISVINSDVFIVRNSIICNTNGTLPESGIDFESNYSTDICKNNVIENCVFYGNVGGSVVIGNQKVAYEVVVRNCTSNDNKGVNIYGTSVDGVARGYMYVQSSVLRNSSRCFNIEGKSSTGLFVKVSNCELYAGASNGVCVEYNSDKTDVLGGIRIVNCSVDNPNSTVLPIRIINNKAGGTYEDVIIDVTIETKDKSSIYTKGAVTGSAKVKTGKTRKYGSSHTAEQYDVVEKLDMDCSKSDLTVTFKESYPYNCPITIRKIAGANSLVIKLENGLFSQKESNTITLAKLYDSITITHETTGVWSVNDTSTSNVV